LGWLTLSGLIGAWGGAASSKSLNYSSSIMVDYITKGYYVEGKWAMGNFINI
jgi:hypothetical protein